MKKKSLLFISIVCILITIASHPESLAEETSLQTVISGVKLSQESLPAGVKVSEEVWANAQQLLRVRTRVGFPLVALMNQAIIYDSERARVNYMITPDIEWLNFGYSKLISANGSNTLVLIKDGVLIQLIASSEDFESDVVRLLNPDVIQCSKIKSNRLPEEWRLVREHFLSPAAIPALDRVVTEKIRRSVIQEFLAGRETLTVTYYSCVSPEAAEQLAQYLAGMRQTLIKKSIRYCGTLVVTADSQRAELNGYILELVNW